LAVDNGRYERQSIDEEIHACALRAVGCDVDPALLRRDLRRTASEDCRAITARLRQCAIELYDKQE
jgi:hypothetical protein